MIHCLSIASVIVAIGLLFAGFAKIAGFIIGLSTLVELVIAVFTGKKSNEGSH